MAVVVTACHDNDEPGQTPEVNDRVFECDTFWLERIDGSHYFTESHFTTTVKPQCNEWTLVGITTDTTEVWFDTDKLTQNTTFRSFPFEDFKFQVTNGYIEIKAELYTGYFAEDEETGQSLWVRPQPRTVTLVFDINGSKATTVVAQATDDRNGFHADLHLTPDNLNFTVSGGSKTISSNSVDWLLNDVWFGSEHDKISWAKELSNKPGRTNFGECRWLSFKVKGAVLTVTVAPNTTGAYRSGVLEFRSVLTDTPCRVRVTQAAN